MIDYTAWLKDPAAVRVVLVEVKVRVNGSETTRFLSTKAYTTSPTDSPPNQYYEPVVLTGLKFTESMSLDGQGSFSAGDVEVQNPSGVRDNWLDDVWDNREIKAWIGDPRWARTDFQMIFNGVVAAVGSKSRDVLNITMRDKLQRLNTPATEQVIGGTESNKDDVLSLTFGEVHNVTPQLTNSVTLEYQVHDGAIESVIEVRDNGKPVSAVINSTTGRFRLNRNPAGTITCSIQGDKGGGTYANTPAPLIRRIVKGYGQSDSRFTDDDIDTANFSTFETANKQPIGDFADGRTNVLTLCQEVAGSVGAQMVMSRAGQLRLLKVELPPSGTPIEVRPQDIVERSLKVKERPFVKAAVKLGFVKNWTVQDNLETGIPEEHKNLYSTEWLTTTASDTAVQTVYKLNTAPVQVDTFLLRRTDAQVEAQRRLALWSVPRTVYEFEATAQSALLASLELGTAVKLYNKRFGLENGKTGMVVSLTPDWTTARVTVGLLI